MTTTFNVTDKKFQISDEFLPDKTSTWKHPAEKDGWMHAHNSIRLQLQSLVEVLKVVKERGTLEEWEVECISKVCDGTIHLVQDHHENEDEVFTPFLKTRFHYPEKCETDHGGLHVLQDKLGGLAKSLKSGDTVDALYDCLVELEEYMLPHLKEEEDTCLPLLRAYFTPADTAPKVQEVIAREAKASMGAFIYTMGEDAFRNEFMKQEGIPFFVWYIQFMWQLRAFKNEILKPMEALKAGKK